jgi:hypothetical protein
VEGVGWRVEGGEWRVEGGGLGEGGGGSRVEGARCRVKGVWPATPPARTWEGGGVSFVRETSLHCTPPARNQSMPSTSLALALEGFVTSC